MLHSGSARKVEKDEDHLETLQEISGTSLELLGVKVNLMTKDKLLSLVETAVDLNVHNGIIANHNLHSVYLVRHDPDMRAFYRDTLCTHVDGMSLIQLGRMFGLPARRSHRTGYLDWFDDFLALAERKQWRIYFLGGLPSVAEQVPAKLRKSFPKICIRSHHGYDAFQPETAVWEDITSYNPQLVLVGMGMPLQERWILQARKRIRTNLFFQCGAIMDYLVGEQRPAPRWLGQLGLEWLFRLALRPRVMAYRYLVEPLQLAPAIVREGLVKKFGIRFGSELPDKD